MMDCITQRWDGREEAKKQSGRPFLLMPLPTTTRRYHYHYHYHHHRHYHHYFFYVCVSAMMNRDTPQFPFLM